MHPTRAYATHHLRVHAGLVLLLIIAVALLTSGRRPEPASRSRDAAATPMRTALDRRLDSLDRRLHVLASALATERPEAARSAFRTAREHFKKLEFLLAYYAPAAAGQLNGPVESDDPELPAGPLGQRSGFARVEHALFADDSLNSRTVANTATHDMIRVVRAFRESTHLLYVSDTALLDAARLEVARVITMGIAGYDSDQSSDALLESAAALEGIGAALANLQSPRLEMSQRMQTVNALVAAARALRARPSFDGFDRFGFIVRRGIPAARAVAALRRTLDSRPAAVGDRDARASECPGVGRGAAARGAAVRRRQ